MNIFSIFKYFFTLFFHIFLYFPIFLRFKINRFCAKIQISWPENFFSKSIIFGQKLIFKHSVTIARIEGHNDDAGWKLMYVDVHFPRKFILKVPTVNEATNTSSRITYFHKWSSVAKNQSSRKLARPYAGYFYFGRNHGCNTQWLENLSKSLILQHCERSELEIVFCLRNGASFGKSQLLNENFGK